MTGPTRGEPSGRIDPDSIRTVEPAPVVDPLAILPGATVDAVGDVVEAPPPTT